MPQVVYVNGKAVRLKPSDVIGQGGEAVVYGMGSEALKVYLEPTDPAFHGDPDAQAGARERLLTHQQKLPAFPAGLPDRVVTPKALAHDAEQRVAGYVMQRLTNVEPLLMFGNRKYREQGGIDANKVVGIFIEIHEYVTALHRAGIIIGDFNDLNILIDNLFHAWLVDADSMGFGKFRCKTFTQRFVDPLICRPDSLVMARPHSELSDWYAFSTMLFQSLVYLSPYFGGVHKPPKGQKQHRDTARVLNRVSVFSPDVRIPKDAMPLNSLPDELLDHFKAVYDSDARGAFPLALLRTLRWTSCTACGSVHARNICPSCMAPGAVTQKVTVTGNVTATRLFQTSGTILFATYQGGELRYVYHESGTYRREGGVMVLTGEIDQQLRVHIWRDATVLAKGTSLFALHSNGERDRYTTQLVGRLPVFAVNDSHLYWLEGNRLVHDARLGVVGIGDILPNRTLVWVGKTFGFGFYRAGTLTRGFVFDAERPGLNDSVPLPPMRGNLIDATCTFSDDLAWFMLEIEDGGVIKRSCYVINDHGELLATVEASPGDDTWLNHGIRGHYARGNNLFVATDAGIVRVTFDTGLVGVSREYPATERFVSAGVQLLPAPGGIAVVSTREITLLRIK